MKAIKTLLLALVLGSAFAATTVAMDAGFEHDGVKYSKRGQRYYTGEEGSLKRAAKATVQAAWDALQAVPAVVAAPVDAVNGGAMVVARAVGADQETAATVGTAVKWVLGTCGVTVAAAYVAYLLGLDSNEAVRYVLQLAGTTGVYVGVPTGIYALKKLFWS